MIELDINKYSLLEEPLKKVEINHLFARSVIEKKVKGKVFVDKIENPKSFYVVHLYGMSLLFGDNKNEEFNNHFFDYCLNRKGDRSKFEWMQAFPNNWDSTLSDLFGDKLVKESNSEETPKEKIELNTRVNFKFNLEKYHDFKKSNITEKHLIKRTNIENFNKMRGSVIPAHFWNTAEDFCSNGVGFSLFHEGELATTAYSAFIFSDKLELGMETIPDFRGRGFAQYACSALIDYCVQNNYEPVWACKLTNTPSYKLAQKLGFVPVLTIPYYRLAL